MEKVNNRHVSFLRLVSDYIAHYSWQFLIIIIMQVKCVFPYLEVESTFLCIYLRDNIWQLRLLYLVKVKSLSGVVGLTTEIRSATITGCAPYIGLGSQSALVLLPDKCPKSA